MESDKFVSVDTTARRTVVLTAVAAVTVVLSDTLVRWALSPLLGPLSALVLTILLFVVLVGVDARWGVAFGSLISGAAFGNWDAAVALSLAGFTATTVCAWLWADPDRNSVAWLGHYLGVVMLTAVTLGAMRALLADIFGLSPFWVTIAQSWAVLIPMSLLGIPIVWVASGRTVEQLSSGKRIQPPQRSRLLVSLIVLLWGMAGYLISFLFEALDLVPEFVVYQNLGEAVGTVVVTLASGNIAVTAVGVIALVALSIVMHQPRMNSR